MPKTGTSFAYTLVAHRCGGVLPPEQLFAYLANVSRRGRQAYDLERALIDRARAACEIGRGTRSRIVCGGRLTLPLFGHTPVKRRGNATLVGFFRRPAQRLLSAFYHEKHAVGPNWQRARRDPIYAALNASAWARWPGIAGCQTKMLTGFHCGADVPLTDELVARAVGVLRTRFAFVGLTEAWQASLQLFHERFLPGVGVERIEIELLCLRATAHPRGRRGALVRLVRCSLGIISASRCDLRPPTSRVHFTRTPHNLSRSPDRRIQRARPLRPGCPPAGRPEISNVW